MSDSIEATGVLHSLQDVWDNSVFNISDQLLDLSPAAIYVCGRDGAIVRYNRRAVELWGRAPKLGDPEERFCGSFRMHRLHGGPLPHNECPVAEVLCTGISARDQEVVIERPDGSRIVALANIDPVRDTAGKVVGAINCFQDITERKRAEEILREREERLAAELADIKLLQGISEQLVHEGDIETLYEKFADAAVAIMRSEYASIQMLYPERGSGGELRLLAFRGFNPEAARFWKWVRADSQSTCGAALRSGKRVIVADVEKCDFMAGSEDLETYLQTGIHAVQTTPLISRSGALLGMISTHWREPHDPPERDLRLLDVLARQAADLIERVKAEQALRESEARLRAIITQATAGIAESDLTGRFVYVNDRFCDIVGYSRVELLGLRVQDITHPEDLPRNMELFERLARGGSDFVLEKRYIRKDGSNVWVSNSVAGIRDSGGTLTNIVAVSIDITKRRRAEQDARRLVAIVESSGDAIVSKDLNGIIDSWNKGAERLFGYSAPEAIGQSIMILIPPERQDEEAMILDRIRRGERVDHYETVRRRKDGSLVDISLTISPVMDASGRIVGASKVARDITEQKRAQEQQAILLREMSHRIKNLFAVAGSVVSLSAHSARTPQDMAEAVQQRLAALTRAHELTRPGLIDPGEKGENDTTLHALIRTIFAPYGDKERATEGGIIVLNGPDAPIRGKAITSLALVLHELATNAAKYGALSLPGGLVKIDCSLEESELLLTWREDGGPPVAREPDSEGFGGLLTRRIVEYEFRGRLSNEWLPEGLIVRLALPLARLAA